jgi:hypothetical protein
VKAAKTISIYEFYSSQGVHYSFLTALLRNLGSRVDSVLSDRQAYKKPAGTDFQAKYIHPPNHWLARELYFAAVTLLQVPNRRKPAIVTGASALSHLVIGLFFSPRRLLIVMHSEFTRAEKLSSIGDVIRKIGVVLYRARGFHLCVLSKVVCEGVIETGLYDRAHLHVITHPLLPQETAPREGRVRTGAVIGLIRKQKLENFEKEIPKLAHSYQLQIGVLGKVMGVSREELQAIFDFSELRTDRYSDDDEKRFIEIHKVGALIFLPGDQYRFTASGLVCDATRLGCVVIGPEDCAMAKELIGSLYNPENRELTFPSSKDIENAVNERAETNRLEVDDIFRLMSL